MSARLAIFLTLFLIPSLAFGMAEQPKGSSGGGVPGSAPGVETCFGSGDVGYESNCIREAAVDEKQVTYCTMIRIPQMIRQCIDEVARVTAIGPECGNLGEFREYCEQAAKH